MTARAGITQHGYRFGVFRLYPAQRLLLRGDEAESVGQTVLNILAFLVENAGRVLTKEEIIAGAWLKINVDNTTLATYIGTLRKILGPGAIVTINNQGYQLTLEVERLAETGPPPLECPRPSTTLPPPAAIGIGRKRELAAAAEHCRQHRLLTVVGPGGIGKTWFAIELGHLSSENFPDGVRLIDLAPAKDPASVASVSARALGVALRGGEDPVQTLATWFGNRKMLVILDSCEYVAGPVAALAKRLLDQAPLLSLIATSQDILDIGYELVFRLDPLEPPDAMALFDARARAADRRYSSGDGTNGLAAEICHCLDGIPLALEMAASLVPVLGIKGVCSGLNHRFEMLESGRRTAATRQRTLRGMMEWSFGLLDAAERKLFCRLARFSGSFSLAAAIAVAGADGEKSWDVMRRLRRLVDRSLLISDGGEEPRYRLLETARLYGAETLKEDGETDLIAERHARYFIELFVRADAAWETTPDSEWLRIHGPEIDNIRAALDWALEQPGNAQIGIALGGASARLWYILDLAPEGRRYCDRLVELIDQDTHPADAARLLRYTGILWRYADRLRAVALLERSAALYRQIDERLSLGSVLSVVGQNCVYLGRRDDAKAALDEAREILSGSNRLKSLWNVMNDLGMFASIGNETTEAARCLEAAVDMAREANDVLRENIAIFNLGEVEFRRGAADRAIERARESAEALRAANHLSDYTRPLVNLAQYLTIRGEHAEARRHAESALRLLTQEGGRWLRLCLQLWALIAARENRFALAAQLIGWVDAEYARTGEIREPTEQAILDLLTPILDGKLTGEDYRAWFAEGARWSEDRAAEITLKRLVPQGSSTL
jgi:predicted ATPase/DNA-binding winged helix-turn-helix (wHTH) protein